MNTYTPLIIGKFRNKTSFLFLFILCIILLLLLFIFVLYFGRYFNQNSKKTSQNNSEEITIWNGSDLYDPNLFEKDRYFSGDIYMASCFESAVPKNFEIVPIGFAPRIGVVKPVGPRTVGDTYFPYIDVSFHENRNTNGDEILTKKQFFVFSQFISKVIGEKNVINKQIIFGKVQIYKRISNAVIVEYEIVSDPSISYDGTKVNKYGAINVFFMGENPQIIENLKLIYDASKKERDINIFKNFLKTFEPTCFAKSKNF